MASLQAWFGRNDVGLQSITYTIGFESATWTRDQSGTTYNSSYGFGMGVEFSCIVSSGYQVVSWTYNLTGVSSGGITVPSNSTTFSLSSQQLSGANNISIRVETESISGGGDIYQLSIDFNDNGGYGGPGSLSITYNSSIIPFTIPDTSPIRGTDIFLGWSISSNATSAEYAIRTTYNFNAGHYTLYAVWRSTSTGEPYYTVSLGNESENIQYIEYMKLTNTGTWDNDNVFPFYTNSSNIIFTAIPLEGYEVYAWVINGNTYPGTTYTWNNTGSNVVVSAKAKLSSGGSGETTTNGYAWIYNGSKWVKAIPWIYNGSNWVKAIPWIYTVDSQGNGAWKQCGSSSTSQPDIIL